jgi:hypothetical protein
MAFTTQQPNKRGTGVRHAQGRAAARWAVPHDPRQNTKPPGNGTLDAQETRRSEEKLLAVLGS